MSFPSTELLQDASFTPLTRTAIVQGLRDVIGTARLRALSGKTQDLAGGASQYSAENQLRRHRPQASDFLAASDEEDPWGKAAVDAVVAYLEERF